MNKMTKEEYEAWASIPEQPELGDLIKEVARLKKALAEQKRLILEEVDQEWENEKVKRANMINL